MVTVKNSSFFCGWALTRCKDTLPALSVFEPLNGTVGTLKPGANADIAVFELRDGNFPLRDSDGNTINAKRRLFAQLTIKDGRVWSVGSDVSANAADGGHIAAAAALPVVVSNE